jgi:hypothetical protein
MVTLTAPIACFLLVWPTTGHPLLRARDAYADPIKWAWVLGRRGHGRTGSACSSSTSRTSNGYGDMIAAAAISSPVARLRAGSWGVGCDIRPILTFNERAAGVLIAWHYADAGAAPRLVTAYPTA